MKVIQHQDGRHTVSLHETSKLIDVGCDWAESFGAANIYDGVAHCPFCGWVVARESRYEGRFMVCH